jgi:copper chaperone CopZ
MPTKTVTVPGISCGHCVATIERELGNVQGVISVSADQESKRVTVEWTDAGVDWERIRTHLDDICYPLEEA